jgi:hypothetical protein
MSCSLKKLYGMLSILGVNPTIPHEKNFFRI